MGWPKSGLQGVYLGALLHAEKTPMSTKNLGERGLAYLSLASEASALRLNSL